MTDVPLGFSFDEDDNGLAVFYCFVVRPYARALAQKIIKPYAVWAAAGATTARMRRCLDRAAELSRGHDCCSANWGEQRRILCTDC
jgi:hypothetical protein